MLRNNSNRYINESAYSELRFKQDRALTIVITTEIVIRILTNQSENAKKVAVKISAEIFLDIFFFLSNFIWDKTQILLQA